MHLSNFGYMFVVIGTVQYMVRSMQYKLSMLGVPINGESNLFSDNNYFCKVDHYPYKTLKNNHLYICFHSVRETVYSQIMYVGFVKGKNIFSGCLKYWCQEGRSGTCAENLCIYLVNMLINIRFSFDVVRYVYLW